MNDSKITEFEMIDTKNFYTADVVMYYFDYVLVFGLEQEDGNFNYSHDAGTSSPSR